MVVPLMYMRSERLPQINSQHFLPKYLLINSSVLPSTLNEEGSIYFTAEVFHISEYLTMKCQSSTFSAFCIRYTSIIQYKIE